MCEVSEVIVLDHEFRCVKVNEVVDPRKFVCKVKLLVDLDNCMRARSA